MNPNDKETAFIHIKGACEHNLKKVDASIPLYARTVVTGPSGAGKSSLIVDTLFSEGQRRYIETLSTFSRQCLDRLDKPQVDEIDEVPPAVLINRAATIRNASSTVATLTGAHKLVRGVFALCAKLHCPNCSSIVEEYTAEKIAQRIRRLADEQSISKAAVGFSIEVPEGFSEDEAEHLLSSIGFIRVLEKRVKTGRTEYIAAADRFRIESIDDDRLVEAVNTAIKKGASALFYSLDAADARFICEFKLGLFCEGCATRYARATPQMFDFRLSLGACSRCRGFGNIRVLDVDKLIPSQNASFRNDAVDLLRVPSLAEEKKEFLKWLEHDAGISPDASFGELAPGDQKKILYGDGGRWRGLEWLLAEVDKYFLKKGGFTTGLKYRKEVQCPECRGNRLRREALSWRIEASDGRLLHIGDVFSMEIDELRPLFEEIASKHRDAEADALFKELSSLLRYLSGSGLGYLSLSRESRTLSGGELQRVNLASALGSSLVNTLFVLDEPSCGLHVRDARRISRIIDELVQTGNTAVLIEHSPALLAESGHWIEMGPGSGAEGGSVVYQGSSSGALAAETPTALYAAGLLRLESKRAPKNPSGDEFVRICGASKNNLKNVFLDIPLGCITAVTGVSGSGKSTLVEETLVEGLESSNPITTVVSRSPLAVRFISQKSMSIQQISSPASALGLTDELRRIFSRTPEAERLGLKPIDFSTASSRSRGRCSHCSGTGFEKIDMQFLSERLMACPVCKGKRFNNEVQSVCIEDACGGQASYPDVLDMTVDEALKRLKPTKKTAAALNSLKAVDLGYLKLGQPLKTLSSGELQRIKLATAISAPKFWDADADERFLFVFDEPAAGLDFREVEVILRLFERLSAAGHSIVFVDHNLDLIQNADWVVELGPVGGTAGGRVIFAGSPKELEEAKTPTGEELALWNSRKAGRTFSSSAAKPAAPCSGIVVSGAKEYNLKNISVGVERGILTVMSGPSGSGKSTLAFDIIFSEGQRRFLNTMNAYERTFVSLPSTPDVSSITGIPPTVAISQRTSRGGMRSTVATMTEIYPYLRLIFEKQGIVECPNCGVACRSHPISEAAAKIAFSAQGSDCVVLSTAIASSGRSWRKGVQEALADGAGVFIHGRPCSSAEGLTREDCRAASREAARIKSAGESELTEILNVLFKTSGIVWASFFGIDGEYLDSQSFSIEPTCPKCLKTLPKLTSHHFSFNSSIGSCPKCRGFGVVSKELARLIRKGAEFESDPKVGDEEYEVCPMCRGGRLSAEALSVRWRGRSIADVCAMTTEKALEFFNSVKLDDKERYIIGDVVEEIRSKLSFLMQLGLDYLSLDRSAPTLSGGESQRIRLAAHLGSNLSGVCYVLDEPTIGLHAEDNEKLISAVKGLKCKGNTILVVEHDLDTVRSADEVIDMGPGSGRLGGTIVARGTPEEIAADPNSPTGAYLRMDPKSYFNLQCGSGGSSGEIVFRRIKFRNLDIPELAVPRGRLVALTGKSGSGKSSLAREVVHAGIEAFLKSGALASGRCVIDAESASGITGVQLIDQSPLHGNSRSCPATYTNIWKDVREIFGASNEAKVRGFDAGRFTFNKPEGACPECAGRGYKEFTLSYLPHSEQLCEACLGERFNPETLSVHWKGKSIGDVLKMSVDEAMEFFSSHSRIHEKLRLMSESGLGYLQLGQSSGTLSGGEGQRIKLVAELSGAGSSKKSGMLYILDEPTVGLHMREVELLIRILRRLVDNGATVLVIEHNLEFIAACDYIIDLGPGGGSRGGRIAAAGTPDELSSERGSRIGSESPTMKALRKMRFGL